MGKAPLLIVAMLLPFGCASRRNPSVKHVAYGTVAQYVHVSARVPTGARVRKGEVIAVTSRNGFICRPQLHFGVYRSRRDLYDSPTRRTLPLEFEAQK